MKRTLTVGLALASLVTWSCGERQAPTSPSTSLPGASLSVIGPGSSTNLTVAWSCLTQGVGCPARLGQLAPSPAALIAPGAPGNLMASVNGSTVSLGWTGPTSGDSPTSYVIEAGSAPGASNLVVFDTGSAGQGFTATSVPAGTYYVRVLAKNAAGTGGATNEVRIIVGGGGPCTSGTPSPPSGLTSSVSGSSVSLSWTAPAEGCANGYVIEAGSTPGSSNLANFNTESTATTFSAGSVPAGTYYVRVRAARTPQSVSGPSNELTVTVTTGAPPPGPSDLTGRWVGVTPEGMIVELDPYDQCPFEYDLQLDLTSSGTAVTGTATTRLRRVEAAGDCSNVLGEVATWSVINGKLGSGTISFALGDAGIFRFSGTFTATRMTGTFVLREFTLFSQTGSFVVNRQ